MTSEEKEPLDLNESWVEVSVQPIQYLHTPGTIHSAIVAHSIHSGDFEKLLIDAQRESAQSSRHDSNKSSQKGSPKGPNSPNNELATSQLKSIQDMTHEDWMWNWSSRLEPQPPSAGELEQMLKHPVAITKPHLSLRNTQMMKDGIYIWENLPTLLITHACSFVIGAAVMFIFMKKYYHLATTTAPSTG